MTQSEKPQGQDLLDINAQSWKLEVIYLEHSGDGNSKNEEKNVIEHYPAQEKRGD